MSLGPGTRLGPYEIQSALGAGGMGEVYRARDTRLKREVALKILPASFASDPDRLARFQREAEVLAALNHPNIAAIYGLEEGQALVMELVEGETLAHRLAPGAIPVEEALPIAEQIAEALDAAHERGIIHRDLKPANLKVRPDGTVKVLDFGLAKLNDPNVANVSSDPNALSLSPTITSPALMTGVGVLLGTAAYMSPEQAKGKPADKRSDIWAFGCVLYEMLTGHRAFRGDETAEVLGAILHLEPDWQALPPELGEATRALLQGCLAKDRRRRVADITTALFVIDRAKSLTPQEPVARKSRIVALSAAAIVVAGAAGTVVWSVMRQDPPPPHISRLSLGATGTFTPTIGGNEPALTMTPDGSRLVYVGNGGTQLFVRRLDALEPTAVFTGSPDGPFVSPDGRWIGFADGIALKKVAVTGGAPVTFAMLDGAFRGGTRRPGDRIIFATFSSTTGLQSVAASGGPTKILTQPDRTIGEGDHEWPELLPDGRGVLFTILPPNPAALDAAQVGVLDFQTGASKVLVPGATHARYVNSGHLVYQAGGALRAMPFDVATLESRGTALPVVDNVMITSFGGVKAFVE